MALTVIVSALIYTLAYALDWHALELTAILVWIAALLWASVRYPA